MKNTILYGISLMFMFLFRFVPALPGMTVSGMQVLGILIGTLILWIAVSIDWPSMLCLAALAFVPELTVNGILAASFGNNMYAFLLFTFCCTHAVSQTSFVKRCSVAFISNQLAMKGPWWFVTLYCLSILIIGMFMSPVVLFVIYLPIMETICDELKLKKEDKLANILILGQLFCCAISCGMTPIAHLFPVMSMSIYQQTTGNAIGYASYMAAAVPVGLICFVVMMLMFRFMIRPEMEKLRNLNLEGLKKELKPLEKREKMILTVFFLVVAMWVLPELVKPVLPGVYQFFNAKGTTFPPMIGSVVLFLLSSDGKPLLNFKDAMTKGVPWGSLIMAAATLALGNAMTNAEIGLTAWMSAMIQPVLANLAPVVIVLVFLVWSGVMTNLCSNIVTATVVTTIAVPICLGSNGAISAAAVAAMVGMLASYAYVFPPAHPNVAVAIGTGWTKTSQIIKYGMIMLAVSILVTLLVGYPIAGRLMV